MKRYFCHEKDIGNPRTPYWYWSWDPETLIAICFFKDGIFGVEIIYKEDRVFDLIRTGKWVEIPAAEAVLMG